MSDFQNIPERNDRNFKEYVPITDTRQLTIEEYKSWVLLRPKNRPGPHISPGAYIVFANPRSPPQSSVTIHLPQILLLYRELNSKLYNAIRSEAMLILEKQGRI